MKSLPYLLFFIFLFNRMSFAQLTINEGSNRNYTQVASPSGEFDDWVELYNGGNQSVNLLGYYLSDDEGNLKKWNFPAATFLPNSFIMVFANGLGFSTPTHHWETAIYDSSLWHYFTPTVPQNQDWIIPGFDASAWLTGKGGIGFGDNDDQTEIASGIISLYMLHSFYVPDISKISAMVVHVDYDDGFVAYLNGTEIARKNLTGKPPAWNEAATSHEAVMYSGGNPEAFSIDPALLPALLKDGENVFAIEVHNSSFGSTDLTARPFLSFGIIDTSSFWGLAPAFVTSGNNLFETNFKIDADGEIIYLSDADLNIIDSLFVGNLELDYSTGKFPDGSSNTGYFKNSTPGSSNNTSTFYTGYEPLPVVSPEAGFYSGNQIIAITTTSPTAEIRYTTNGSEPTTTSAVYSMPFELSTSHVVKAKCFSTAGLLPSATATQTLFINETFSLPVISISTDSLNLWGPNGICDNWWTDWKKPCYIEYFDTAGINQFKQCSAIKIDGGAGGSRSQPQHSFRLNADNDAFGDGAIQYPLIPDRSKRNQYESFFLRNGSNMYLGMFYKDAFQGRIFKNTHTNYQAYRPVVAFVNGEYWGVYELREKQDDDYFKQNYATDPDSLDLLSLSFWYNLELRTLSGSDVDFYIMRNKIVNGNPLDSKFFSMADSMLDLVSYTDYIIAETWFGNYDWPDNNIKIWRSRNTTNKWRFGLIDLENGMPPWGWSSAASNLLAYLLNYDTSNLFISPWQVLINNNEYKNYFVNRYADLMNTELLNDTIKTMGDLMFNEVYPSMSRHYQRWGDTVNNSVQDYLNNLQSNQNSFTTAMKQRLNNTRKHIKSSLVIADTVGFTLDVFPAGAGKIKISTIKPANYPWSGIYFEDIPVDLTVVPNPGYLFSHWTKNIFIADTNNQSITVTSNVGSKYVANFITTSQVKLVINEFNYNSEPTVSSGDWIEIHNHGMDAIELTDWYLRDDNDEHQFNFPDGKKILAGEVLVIVSDSQKFKQQNPGVTNFIGEFDFGLSSIGDIIRLYSPLNEVVESVSYSNASPWPLGAGGEGRTAERLNPDAAADDAANWFDGCIGGSPGTLYAPCNDEVVISEINYNSGSTYPSNDWIELRNISQQNINLSGWTFKDDNDSNIYVIPSFTLLMPNSNLVLARYLYDFSYTYPDVTNVLGDFGFNLSGSGEWLRLYDAAGKLKISVHYSDSLPFPTEADGTGYTLELKDSLGKMNDGNNWFAGCEGGSPGKYYKYPCGIPTVSIATESINYFTIMPSVADQQATLQYRSNNDILTITFSDLSGRVIYKQPIFQQDQSVIIDTKNWLNGLVIWNIRSGSELVKAGKLIINHAK